MNTFFCISVYELDGISRPTDIKLGPYATLSEAQTILLEFLPMVNDIHKHQGYLAVVTEMAYTKDGWITIDEALREEYEYTR